MINRVLGKTIIFTLVLSLLCGQSFAQLAPVRKDLLKSFNADDIKIPVAVQDNTRVVNHRLNEAFQKQTFSAVAAQLIIDHNDYSAAGMDGLNKLANDNIAGLLEAVSTAFKPSKETADLVFFAVLPKLYMHAVFEDVSNYSKIRKIYTKAYEDCIYNKPSCNYERGGYATVFLAAGDVYDLKLTDIAALAKNPKLSGEDRIAFLQYAAPVLSQKGGRIHFEDIINTANKQTDMKMKPQSGYVDPFILVKIVDGGYEWVKEACSHQDGFWKGACAKVSSDKPFKEYMRAPRPSLGAEQQLPYALYTLDGIGYKDPSLLASAIRLYGEFYSDEYFWKDTFNFLYNLPAYGDYIVSSHLDIALSKMLLKAPADFKDLQKFKNYVAASLNNDYFSLNLLEDGDPAVRATLQNEVGAAYAALKGYKGQSPLAYTTDEGFRVQINFKDNEKQIESFTASLFNFKDRPAEALTNIFIIGAITKGLAKNGDKIMAAAGRALSSGGKAITNMPAIISRARAQYKALQYLSSKNGMSFAKYAYRNNQYRKAAQVASKANILTVEGKAAGEFFKSVSYNPSSHGNIGRVASDVKQAARAGVQHLGIGGTVPSYVDEATFAKGVQPFAADYSQQQRLQVSISNKYKATALEVSKSTAAAQQAAADIKAAPYALPRRVLHSSNAGYLPLAQDIGFAKDYLLRNQAFSGLNARGFRFFDTGTGKLIGPNLTFHHEGYLQAHGRIGLAFENITTAAAPASVETALQTVAKQTPAAIAALRNTTAAAYQKLLPKVKKAYSGYQALTLAALNGIPVTLPQAAPIVNAPLKGFSTDVSLAEIYGQSGREYLERFGQDFVPSKKDRFFNMPAFRERLGKLIELTPYISPLEWNYNNQNSLLYMLVSNKPARWEMFSHYYNAIMADLPQAGRVYAMNNKLSGDWLEAVKTGPVYISTDGSATAVQDMMIESEIRTTFNMSKPYAAIQKHLFSFEYGKNRVGALLDGIADKTQFEQTGKMLMSYIEELKDLGSGNVAALNGAAHWEAIDEITPQTIAISHEIDDITIGEAISKWIQKSNIPYKGKDVLQFMPDYIESTLGISAENPGILIKFEDSFMLYNNDYSARIRFGNHEIEDAHIHFEFKNRVPSVLGHATRTNFSYRWPEKYTDFDLAGKEMFHNYISVLDAKGFIADQTGTLTGHVQPFMKPQEELKGLVPSEYAHSTFKVYRKDGNSGSGFYVNYHGIPMVLTAAHVVLADTRLEVSDFNGNITTGRLMHKMSGGGYDIAAIAVDYDFLKGRQPFAIAKNEPKAGDILLQHSFPIFNRFRTIFRSDIVKLLNPGFLAPYLRNPLYLGTRSSIDGGSSGGPLTMGYFQDEVVGITHAITPDNNNSLFMPLPNIKSFLGVLGQKLLFEDYFREKFLPGFPGFSARYPNILNRFGQDPNSISLYRKYMENRTGIRSAVQDISVQEAGAISAAAQSGQTPGEIEDSVVKIRRSAKDGENATSGTGFYIEYRGLPMLLTASHVVGDNKFVELYDSDGIFGTGEVFAKTGNMFGYDLAIVLPNDGFLEGKTPLKLSLSQGIEGDKMHTIGYPAKKWLTHTDLTLTNKPTQPDMIKSLKENPNADIYTLTPGVLGGNSGGPLLKADNTVLGVAHKGAFPKDDKKNALEAYYITLPNIRKFLRLTLKNKFLDASFSQKSFLKQYPLLAKNYENVISRFKDKMGTQVFGFMPTVYEKDIETGSFFKFGRNIFNVSAVESDDLYFASQAAYNKNFNRIKSGVFELENSITGATGTGFYVQYGKDAALLTAGHMLRNASTVLVRPAMGNKFFSAKVAGAGTGDANDIGIVEVDNPEFWKLMQPLTPSANSLVLGDEIISYGFPWGSAFEDRIGKITNFETYADGNMIRATEHTAPGSSGSPILFRNQIVGMCASGVCSEDLPYMIQKTEPFSLHTPWANIERFLNIMKLWTLPPSLRIGVDFNNPKSVSNFLRSLKNPVVLNPKAYHILNRQPVIFINPYEQFTEFDFNK